MVATGYNQDLVVENGAVPQGVSAYGAYVTATMDGNVSKSGTTYYERGLNTSAPMTGLPTADTPFTSADLPNVVFQLQSYSQSNALLLTNNQTGTLTLTAPTAFSSIAFLVATGNGNGGTEAITLHFGDGTPAYAGLSLSAPSWFDGSNPAFISMGRVDVPSGGFFNVGSNNPRLYDGSFDLAALGLAGHTISSIDFTFSGDGNAALFALSGSVVPEPNSQHLALAFGSMAVFVAGLRAWKKRRA